MSVEDMIKCVVISSANDAAVALAEFISGSEEGFVSLMNTRAAESVSYTHLLYRREYYDGRNGQRFL